jgi:hypothetical protein
MAARGFLSGLSPVVNWREAKAEMEEVETRPRSRSFSGVVWATLEGGRSPLSPALGPSHIGHESGSHGAVLGGELGERPGPQLTGGL